VAIRGLYAEPPYRRALLDGQRMSLPWHEWFQRIADLGRVIEVSATYDPASIASGSTAQATVTATGAVAGDFAVASFVTADVGVVLLAAVTATDTVTVTFWNVTGGAIDLASGTLRVRVEAKRT
jgi:hypothetical protein